MPLYVVGESISTHKKIVTFKGVIMGDSFNGIGSGNPLTERDHGPWLIKRKGDGVRKIVTLNTLIRLMLKGK